MNLTENQINEITSLIKENEVIYERRQYFQKYYLNTLGIGIPIYNFDDYDELIHYRQVKNDSTIYKKIISNDADFRLYYQDIFQEINNNKKILSMVKNDILYYIKNKSIISVEQIKQSNFEFLTDFYINFFLEELLKLNKLEEIEILALGDIKQKLYKLKANTEGECIMSNSNKKHLRFLPQFDYNPYSFGESNKIDGTIQNQTIDKSYNLKNGNTSLNINNNNQRQTLNEKRNTESRQRKKSGQRLGRIKYGSFSFWNSLGFGLTLFIFPPFSIIFLISLIVTAKDRFHDLDKSGLNALLLLIPLFGLLVHFYLLLAGGTKGNNDYGKPPESAGV
ncbi:Inner membrane protein yhaI [Moraxella lacunata]|uniref:Inner membrane protein yhaI n=1 Tax=Moraxella lacunata TaxID=477 RepID=A0A378QH94_MORLA|nr:DUF805 domain-containing protein [Moraxella lacunata]STY98693.1 Inner membrane protein yhaI [Moraxella lacunata]